MPKQDPEGGLAEEVSPKIVSFRLDPQDSKNLVERAEIAGVSPGHFAKCLVLEALNRAGQMDEVKERILALEHALTLVREDIALSTEVLLVAAGHTPKDAAAAWVTDNLKRS